MLKILFLLACLLIVPPVAGAGSGYLSPGEMARTLRQLAKKHKRLARIRVLGKTPGGREIVMLSVGDSGAGKPAILVLANLHGDAPVASRAALELARLLLGEWTDAPKRHTWHILPVGNPDGYAAFFEKPLGERFTNDRPVNDDHDEATGEDGPEDLNRDGLITMMRQKHPGGTWMPVENNPVLMKEAERGKGEKGIYRLFSEGIDNDSDGAYNEDGPGGVNPGRNFPHQFKHYTRTGGRWAASEPESRAVLEFAYAHPEIAMLLTFGRVNSVKKVPAGAGKLEAGQDKYKVPERIAKRVGLDPQVEYPLKDLVQMAREFTGHKELTEDMVLMFLGVGAAVKPDAKDLPYWNEVSKRYQDFLGQAGLDGQRLDPPDPPPGSPGEWGYYQYGVVSLGLDFWSLPSTKKKGKPGGELTPEKIEKMSKEDFLALGQEKINQFLREVDAPAHLKAEMVFQALHAGMLTPKKIAGMLRKHLAKKQSGGVDETDQALYAFNPGAFLPWKPFDHPTLGPVEIGGRRPYAHLLPPKDRVDDLIRKQLPFVRTLAGLLPRIAIDRVDVKKKAPGVWEIEVWAVNRGFFPYPTHQGERCKRPPPAVLTIDAGRGTLLEGRPRKVLKLLPGSGGTGQARWIVQGRPGSRVTLEALGYSAGRDRKVVVLKGGSQ